MISNLSASNIGFSVKSMPGVFLIYRNADTQKIMNTITSNTSIIQFSFDVNSIPIILITVFIPTNSKTHAQNGTVGSIAAIATAATTYKSAGTNM